MKKIVFLFVTLFVILSCHGENISIANLRNAYKEENWNQLKQWFETNNYGNNLRLRTCYYMNSVLYDYKVNKTIDKNEICSEIIKRVNNDTVFTENQKKGAEFYIIGLLRLSPFKLTSREDLVSFADANMDSIKKSHIPVNFIADYLSWTQQYEQAYVFSNEQHMYYIALKCAVKLNKSPEEIKQILNDIRINASKLSPYRLKVVLDAISELSYDNTYDEEIKNCLIALNRALYPKLGDKSWKQSLIQLKLTMNAYGL